MTSSIDQNQNTKRITLVLIGYPIITLLVSIGLNFFALGVNPYVVALPSSGCFQALVITGVLLAFNHTWIMTATELTRNRFKIYSTPEEWASAGKSPKEASEHGIRELERNHNTHRNTTENTVIFILITIAFVLSSPPTSAALTWLLLYGFARLGFTYSYLSGKDNLRGLFMTLGLLAIYGMSSYLVMSLVV